VNHKVDSERGYLDLTQALVHCRVKENRLAQKALEVLIEEVRKRTNISWEIIPGLTLNEKPIISLDLIDPVPPTMSLGESIEGFQIQTESHKQVTVSIRGNSPRGLLYGVGYFLRQLSFLKGQVFLRNEINLTSSPSFSLRGHQLGYRDKTNSYDGWDLKQWDQYIRELVIFGANAIELIPPHSDDRTDSPHFPLPPMKTMVGMSKIAESYGIDTWIWFPLMENSYSLDDSIIRTLHEAEEVFQNLPRVDAVMIPGGDPGNTPPEDLFPLLVKFSALLGRYHPKAQLWVSPQGFNKQWMEEFIKILHEMKPSWLTGVVFGPWIHMPISQFRELIPSQYLLRNYPDITHTLDCQYPVPEWDIAFALTEGREPINPRPVGQKIIFQQMGKDITGFITYSEGCNDDVNKIIWCVLGWSPETDVVEILHQYSRFFIGDSLTYDFSKALLNLERNWHGPLVSNSNVLITLQQFQSLERNASPHLAKNWRFQQALFRAYYDAYVYSRLLYESNLEQATMGILRIAKDMGSMQALDKAIAILNRAILNPINSLWKIRIYQLAEALFQSIHMQLSVPLYRAQSETRGANLDAIDFPLNDRSWLLDQFARIREIPIEEVRLDEIRKIIEWRNPGAGGYYVDLSDAYECPYLVREHPYESDPAFYFSPQRRFAYSKDPRPIRRSWRGYTGALGDQPLRLSFPNLDPLALYKLRIVYSDTEPDIRIRLVANESLEIHPWIFKPYPIVPLEFDIPGEATKTGSIELSLYREEGMGGIGAGHEISEIWIIKKENYL